MMSFDIDIWSQADGKEMSFDMRTPARDHAALSRSTTSENYQFIS